MKKLILAILILGLSVNAWALKVEKIEATDLGIVVTVEGYPHAQPTFPADTKAEDMRVLLEAWKVNQDAVDEINANAQPSVIPEVSEELKDLEGKEL